MVAGNAGKGDTYRPQSAKEKRQYDINYLRVFGEPCPNKCNDGWLVPLSLDESGCRCPVCKGLGYIERKKDAKI
jgi:hypothetical protein